MNPMDLPARWSEAHQKWCEADEDARLAEERLKLVESELFNHMEGGVEVRKHLVREAKAYQDATRDAVTKRTAANLALGEKKKLEMASDIWRSLESSRRAEMNLR